MLSDVTEPLVICKTSRTPSDSDGDAETGHEGSGGSDEPDTHDAAGGEPPSFARTTNLFRKTSEGWRMILHHASPIPGESEEAEMGAVH